MAPERGSRRPNDEIVEGDLAAFSLQHRVDRAASLDGPPHVHLDRQEEVGNGADRLGQTPGDGLPHLRERNVIELGAGRNEQRCSNRGGGPTGSLWRRRPGRDRRFDVPLHDAPRRPGSRHARQRNARLGGQATSER